MLLINAALVFTMLGGAAPQIQMAATRVEPARVEPARVEPTRSCTAPSQVGTFRVTAMSADSTRSKVGIILLENVEGCLEASMLTDDAGPAIMDHVALAGDMLTGSIRMTTGVGRVSLRVSPAGIAGSIIDGRREWHVAGKRTS
jgi:hypothetical protein